MNHDQLRQIAAEYVLQQRNRHDLRYPDQARSQCANASSELAARYGHGAKRIRLHGHRDPARLDDPHPGGDESEVHYVVYVDGAIVDLTRRQFNHHARFRLSTPRLRTRHAIGVDGRPITMPTIFDRYGLVTKSWARSLGA